MYQDFGAREIDDTKRVRLRLFVPDNALDPDQYQQGTLPDIAQVHASGDFQDGLGRPNWVPDPKVELRRSQFTDPEGGKVKGWLYEITTDPLKGGFYQYTFHLTFNSGATRIVCDPCTRHGGARNPMSSRSLQPPGQL